MENPALYQAGASKDAVTGTQPATQSSSAESAAKQESPNTSDTLGITLEVKSPKDSQLTPNSLAASTLFAFAAKLGTFVEWREMTLGDGRKVFALCFPFDAWEVDTNTNSLRLKNEA